MTHQDPYEAQGKIPVEQKYNKDGYLVEIKVNGHVIAIPEQHQPSVVILDENLKNTEWVKEKIYLTPEEAKARFPELIDPYILLGKDFRVNHPVQPKTQVERWREEYEANDKAIFDCCGYVFNAESGTFEVKNDGCDCPKQGTDRCGKRHNKNKEIGVLVLADHEKNKTYLNRHPVGEFAGDKEDYNVCVDCGLGITKYLNASSYDKTRCASCYQKIRNESGDLFEGLLFSALFIGFLVWFLW